MGYLTALALAPNLLFALHAGAWVDRRGRRRQTMIATDVGRAALLCTVPAAYALDALTLGQLYGVAFAAGALTVLFGVSDASLFVAIVPRERYVEANSLLNGSRAFSLVAGPSLSGLLVQAFSAPGALLLDAFSFLGSGRSWRGSTRKSRRRIPNKAVYWWACGGWRALPSCAPTLLATATINFFNFVFFALFILYATRALDVSPATLGLVLGAGAVRPLVGAAVTGRVTRTIGVGPALIVGCVLLHRAAPARPAGGRIGRGRLTCLFLAEFGSGLGVMLLDISAGSIFAAVIPHRLRSASRARTRSSTTAFACSAHWPAACWGPPSACGLRSGSG